MALITCPECSKEVSDKAESCPVCAFPIERHLKQIANDSVAAHKDELQKIYERVYAERTSKEKNDPARGDAINFKFIISCLAACVFVVGLVLLGRTGSETNQTDSKIDTKPSIADKRTWFNSAKTLLTDKSQKVDDGELVRIKESLEAVTADMPEYKEANLLLPEVNKRVEKYEKLKKVKEEQRRKEAEDAEYTKAGKRIHAKHPEWSAEDCNKIGKGLIHIGMTAEKVRAAWGRPYHINRTSTAYGESEQWVMHEMGGSYVYFENGICTAIQN